MAPLASPAVPETGAGWGGVSRAGLWKLQIQVRQCVRPAGLEGSRHASRGAEAATRPGGLQVALSGVDSGAEGGGVWTSEGMSTVTLYREWPSRCDK